LHQLGRRGDLAQQRQQYTAHRPKQVGGFVFNAWCWLPAPLSNFCGKFVAAF
jgi:hypothetical protein